MSREMYSLALKKALAEIKNTCTDVEWSFLLMNNGIVIAGDEQATDPTIEKTAGSFQTLAEKASAVGGLDNLLVNAEKGRVYVFCVDGMYLISGLNKHADITHFHNITQVILQSIIKVLDSIASPEVTPTPLKPAPFAPNIPSISIPSKQTTEESEEAKRFKQPERPESLEATEEEFAKKETMLPSQELIVDSMVDRFFGLMRSNSAQIDAEILKQWSQLLDLEDISEVEIETLNGRTARCKIKVIDDLKLQGRGLIRIPEKTCEALEIKMGELVRVKPVVQE